MPRGADAEAAHDNFALAYTEATFTGQKRDTNTGLMYYGARFYDPYLGRFISPDSIVPNPGNPQSLNRYSYTLNNPLRYTDPTGMYTEDEIMKYLGVGTWDEVLALFGEGGAFAGQWGLLGSMRQAENGSSFTIMQEICGDQLCTEEQYAGVFGEDQSGNLVLNGSGRYLGTSRSITDLALAGAAHRDQQSGMYYYVDQWRVAAQAKVLKLKFDPSQVDWTNVGLGIGGLGQDAGMLLAIGGAATGNPILLTIGVSMVGIGTASEATGAARAYYQWEQGESTAADLWVSMGSTIFGLYPGPAGVGSSIAGIGHDLLPGLYMSP